MTWSTDDDIEYANGADGFCTECGDETDQPWHLYCADCYAEQQGWNNDDERDDVDDDLDALDRAVPLTEPCPDCGQRRVLFPAGVERVRVCVDCACNRRGKGTAA